MTKIDSAQPYCNVITVWILEITNLDHKYSQMTQWAGADRCKQAQAEAGRCKQVREGLGRASQWFKKVN